MIPAKYTIGQTVELISSPQYVGRICEVAEHHEQGVAHYDYWVTWNGIGLADWYRESHLTLTHEGSAPREYTQQTVFTNMDGTYFSGRVMPVVISCKREAATNLVTRLAPHRNDPAINDLYCLLHHLCTVGEKDDPHDDGE